MRHESGLVTAELAACWSYPRSEVLRLGRSELSKYTACNESSGVLSLQPSDPRLIEEARPYSNRNHECTHACVCVCWARGSCGHYNRHLLWGGCWASCCGCLAQRGSTGPAATGLSALLLLQPCSGKCAVPMWAVQLLLCICCVTSCVPSCGCEACV